MGRTGKGRLATGRWNTQRRRRAPAGRLSCVTAAARGCGCAGSWHPCPCSSAPPRHPAAPRAPAARAWQAPCRRGARRCAPSRCCRCRCRCRSTSCLKSWSWRRSRKSRRSAKTWRRRCRCHCRCRCCCCCCCCCRCCCRCCLSQRMRRRLSRCCCCCCRTPSCCRCCCWPCVCAAWRPWPPLPPSSQRPDHGHAARAAAQRRPGSAGGPARHGAGVPEGVSDTRQRRAKASQASHRHASGSHATRAARTLGFLSCCVRVGRLLYAASALHSYVLRQPCMRTRALQQGGARPAVQRQTAAAAHPRPLTSGPFASTAGRWADLLAAGRSVPADASGGGGEGRCRQERRGLGAAAVRRPRCTAGCWRRHLWPARGVQARWLCRQPQAAPLARHRSPLIAPGCGSGLPSGGRRCP